MHFSEKEMGILDEIMQKDIQTLKERRTRRNSSLGNHFAKASPALVRNPFGKASLCSLFEKLKYKAKESQSYCRGGNGTASVFPDNGNYVLLWIYTSIRQSI